jgi:hypothetical protein
MPMRERNHSRANVRVRPDLSTKKYTKINCTHTQFTPVKVDFGGTRASY